MKVLLVASFFPAPTWGARVRTYYLLKMLARKHTVSLLAVDDRIEPGAQENTNPLEGLMHTIHLLPRPAVHSRRLQQLANAVRGRSNTLVEHTMPGTQEALDELLSNDHYDVVLFDSALIAGYRLPKGVKVVINQHNIEHELLQRTYLRERAWPRKWYNWWESYLLKPVELERCRKADVVLVTSERECAMLKSMLQRSVIEVVPNGVDIETFQGNSPDQEVAGRIIFTGSMDYYPNSDAVHYFAQKCWSLILAQVPEANWQIVGRDPPSDVLKLAELHGVKVIASVPDMRPYFAEAMVAIVPLSIGSGTRLKILEALAMQKAVVSTSLGCEGLSVVPGKHLIVANKPEAFAQAIVELIRNPEKRGALGAAGRSLVEAEYGWERCGDKLLEVLEQL